MNKKRLLTLMGGSLSKLSLDFTTMADGTVPKLIGDTWVISSGKAINTPTLGAELWDADAAAFTSGTYAWVAQGSNTLANVDNTLEITFVNNAAGAIHYFAGASDLTSNLTIGQFYRLQLDTKINEGSATIRIHDGSTGYTKKSVTNTSFETLVTSFKANHATFCYIINSLMDGTEKIYYDNLSIKQITFKDTISSTKFSSSYGTAKAAWTVTGGVGCGVCMNVDSLTEPKNGVFAILNFNAVDLYKLVNGTWTSLFSAAYTYAAGGIVEIRHLSGDTFSLYYNNVQIGTDQTVTGMSGKYHGLFSTDPTALCSEFFFI